MVLIGPTGRRPDRPRTPPRSSIDVIMETETSIPCQNEPLPAKTPRMPSATGVLTPAQRARRVLPRRSQCSTVIAVIVPIGLVPITQFGLDLALLRSKITLVGGVLPQGADSCAPPSAGTMNLVAHMRYRGFGGSSEQGRST